MSITSLLSGRQSEVVSVLPYAPAAQPDAYGNKPKTFGTPVPYRGILWQQTEQENLVDRDALFGDWLLALPATAVIGGYDRVVARGKTFEVKGRPMLYRARGEGNSFIQARLLLVEGE